MNSLMKGAFIGLLALSTTAYAGKGKIGKQKDPMKKALKAQICGPKCPHPCPPGCQKKGA